MAAIAVLAQLSFPFWASRAFLLRDSSALEMGMPVAVALEFGVVAVLLYTTASRFSGMERLAVRYMRFYQLATWVSLAIPLFLSVILSTWIMYDLLHLSPKGGYLGNIGAWVMLKSFIGLWGLGLLVSTFIDRRIASIIPAAFAILPISLDMGKIWGASIWGFVGRPDDDLTSWITALVLLAAGVVMQMFWFARKRR